jgi:hypothetical protein
MVTITTTTRPAPTMLNSAQKCTEHSVVIPVAQGVVTVSVSHCGGRFAEAIVVGPKDVYDRSVQLRRHINRHYALAMAQRLADYVAREHGVAWETKG